MSAKPLCFVLMPYGDKREPRTGLTINFDQIYENAIRPGIEAAGLEPIRSDEEQVGGIIHKPMFERLMLCDYAVADLTTANANVFYELGIRHAARPATTLAIFAEDSRLPFDVNLFRALPYRLGADMRFGDADASSLRDQLTRRLEELKSLSREAGAPDSPVFQLLEEYGPPDIARLKTDVFRERTRYEATVKRRLADARRAKSQDQLHAIEAELGEPGDAGVGVLVDLFLSYRAVKDFQAMVDLYQKMPAELRNKVLIREQLGFALNRLERRDQAAEVLQSVLQEQGPSSETCGLLGRVYKDRWKDAKANGQQLRAQGFLNQAIDMYRRGYLADIRDAYPGVNAVTLLDVRGDQASLDEKNELLPVVRFAVRRRLEPGKPDYWDYATLLELAVLANDESEAGQALADSLARVREPWEPETTANNLRMIQEARAARGEAQDWLLEIIDELESAG